MLRHAAKKPAGGSEELESHFGCPASQLLMVGDRYLTDIVFGNRHGMMTVRPTPLVLEGEPAGVVVVSQIFISSLVAIACHGNPHARDALLKTLMFRDYIQIVNCCFITQTTT